MSKKLFSLFLSLLLIVALSGCQPDNEVTPTPETNTEVLTTSQDDGQTSASAEEESESVETEAAETEAADVETSESNEVETTENQTSESTETQTSESTESETSEPAEATVTSVSVVGTNFAFSPSSLSFTAGETVKLTFRNDGSAPHNLTIEGTSIKTATVGTSETTTLTFTAPAAGTYTFYCAVGGHRDAGMVGTLVTQ